MTHFGQQQGFTGTVSQSVNQSVSEAVSRGSTSTSTSTTTTETRSRACSSDRDLMAIMEAYEQFIGPMNGAIQRIIGIALGAGMQAAVVLEAINTTAWAPRPSARYLAAILRRYQAQGISTIEDVMRDNDRFEQRVNSLKRRRDARWYDEPRLMTDEDAQMFDPF